ncbi:AMP-binding protein [uncultured Tateyamaria sp.]|uniref:phenylacetate--CoA ligase family protein n=1 Tax=uncultured Tateyamaria sp. TaxID=455651 RepID=UPI0026197165|nr:AMP-binding protein [uncultured Tateyamaria sp.]
MLNRVYANPVDCDMLPRAERERYQETALARLLAECGGHPLVAERITGPLALHNITPGESEDHSGAICGIGPYANRPSRDPGACIVFSTSGSSGTERRLVTSYQEIINNARIHGKGYAACGVGSDHTLATFGEVGRFASEFAVIAALDMTGCTIVPLVDRLDITANVALFQELNVDALLAMPSELLGYLDHWETAPETVPALRLVVTGGEPLPAPVRARLQRLFGPELKVRGTFQTADAGTIGYQCTHCADGEFHLHEELQLVELLDESGQAAAEGEMVVTNLYRREMPVIRMKTGDRAAWTSHAERCDCGRTSRRIRLLGRAARLLKIGGEKTSARALGDLGARMVPNGELVQFVVSRDAGGGDVLTAHACAFADPDRARSARDTLLRDPCLGSLYARGRIVDLQVSGALPTHLTGSKQKPRAVVDIRDDASLKGHHT